MSKLVIDEIVAKNIVVRAREDGPQITLWSTGNEGVSAVGLEVKSPNGNTIALCADQLQQPYMIIRGKDGKFPCLAIYADKDGEATFQIITKEAYEKHGSESGALQDVKFVTTTQLLELMNKKSE